MSQHDLNIANQGFPAFRADLNDALVALGSTNSGATAPATTYANQLWYDTANNILKIRNEDNDAWISIVTLDQSGDVVSAITAATVNAGALNATGNLLVGTTTNAGNERAIFAYADASNNGLGIRETTDASGTAFLIFRASNSGTCGVVSRIGTNNAVAYNTTSSSTTGASLVSSGITFPATQVASSDANTLDDYEEGTWTPTFSLGSGSGSFVTEIATYTKIGRIVTLSIRIVSSSVSSAANLAIGGLPFSFANSNADSSGAFREYANQGNLYILSFGSSTTASMQRFDNNNGLPNGSPAFSGTFTYTTNT